MIPSKSNLISPPHKASSPSLATLSQALLAWFAGHGRKLPWREDPSPYHVWLSEIMLQQTRVEAVKGYYERFLQAFPTVADLAAAEEDDYLKLWQGLGYYSRVRNLHKAAVLLTETSDGVLPRDRKSLQALPGIGPYTAAAIASIAYGEKAPAIDGNLLRVFARLSCYEENILTPAAQREAEAFFLSCMDALPGKAPASHRDPGANSNKLSCPAGPSIFNQALMDLGAMICLPNAAPHCEECPLAAHCRARQEGRQEELPLRIKKQNRPVEKMTLLLIHFDGGILLRKRPDKGLLAGLYEYPHAQGFLTEKSALRFVEELGFGPVRIAKLPPSKHLFTHREWQMRAYEVWADQWTDFSRRAPEQRKAEKSLAEEPAGISAAESAAGSPTNDSADDRLFIADREAIRDVWSIPSAFAPYTRYLLGE